MIFFKTDSMNSYKKVYRNILIPDCEGLDLITELNS